MSFLSITVSHSTYAHDYKKRGFTHLYCKPCSLVRCRPARQASPACYTKKKEKKEKRSRSHAGNASMGHGYLLMASVLG